MSINNYILLSEWAVFYVTTNTV